MQRKGLRLLQTLGFIQSPDGPNPAGIILGLQGMSKSLITPSRQTLGIIQACVFSTLPSRGNYNYIFKV